MTKAQQHSIESVTLVGAINLALDHALSNLDEVVLFGEDIGTNGGVFRVTDGLQKKYGSSRVVDSPLAEGLLAGIAVGMATYGLKPIIEFQFSGFMYPAIDQIANHAARMRNRTRGRLHCPIVFRAPYCGGIHAPEHHSESPEAIYAHIPGIRVVIPSTPARAYGLLTQSILNPDPVVFLEPKKLYHSQKQAINPAMLYQLDQAYIDRQGNDLTLIGWGAMMPLLHQVAENMSDSIEIEIIDIATIKPLDTKTIIQSVSKTGRCVIVHEAPQNCGVGAEIAACIAENCITSLIAPVKRVTGYDTVMPYFNNENQYLPDINKITRAVISTMEYSYV